MPDGEWTGRELRHMIERIEGKIDSDGRKLDTLAVEVAKMGANADAVHARLVERVEDLEAWQAWALRVVIGAVILAVLALIIGTGSPRIIQK